MDSLDEMRVFVDVVQDGSFAGTARRLGITASGVSRKISRFEDRLGVRLFNRTTRALSLTEAGEALFDRCDDILSSIEEAEDAVREIGTTPRGTLRVAASDALSLEVIVPFLSGFNEKFEELAVTLVPGDGAIDLLHERVDVAVLFEPPPETSFIASKLINDPWVVCASPSYLSKYGQPQVPEDLTAHQCLTIHARGVTKADWVFGAGDRQRHVRVRGHFSGIGLTVKAAALNGMGIARLAHFLVHAEVADGHLVPLLTDFAAKDTRAIYAVYPNRQHLPSKTRVFIDELKAYVGKTMVSPDGP